MTAIIKPAYSVCSHSGGLCDVGVYVSAVSQGERGPVGPAAVGPRGVPGIPGERGEAVSAKPQRDEMFEYRIVMWGAEGTFNYPPKSTFHI